MNRLLAARSAAQSGVFTTADATECGLSTRGLAQLVRKGVCRQLAHSVYAAGAASDNMDDRHCELTRGFLLVHGHRAAASHHSALLLHGLPVYGADLRRAHLVRTSDRHTRRLGNLSMHPPVGPADLRVIEDRPVVSVARALVQNAMLNGAYNGVVSADAALHRRLVTTEELAQAAAVVSQHPGARAVSRLIRFADGRSESVGESRLRLELLMLGIPVTPQFTVEDGAQVVARADFRVNGTRLLVEFDGMVKYRAGRGEAAVIAEKQREDRLRRLGWLFERVVWRELDNPAWIGARIRSTLGSAGHGLHPARRLPDRGPLSGGGRSAG